MLENGYISLHRSILKWEWYEDANATRLFIHLLLTVNYEPGRWRGQEIGVGQRVTSLSKLAKETKLTVMQIRTTLAHLETTGEITRKATNKYSVITVNNYEKYQERNTLGNKQITRNPPPKQQTNNNKGIKQESNNKEPDNLPGAASASVPVISLVLNDKTMYGVEQEQVDRWKELYPGVNIMAELRKMAGWCEANATKRKTRRGAPAFINTWLSKAQDRPAPGNVGQRKVLTLHD